MDHWLWLRPFYISYILTSITLNPKTWLGFHGYIFQLNILCDTLRGKRLCQCSQSVTSSIITKIFSLKFTELHLFQVEVIYRPPNIELKLQIHFLLQLSQFFLNQITARSLLLIGVQWCAKVQNNVIISTLVHFSLQRNYGCDICSKHFTNASDLTKHKRIHDPDSKISCEFCERKFAQRVNYRNHLRSNHSMKDIPSKGSKSNQ